MKCTVMDVRILIPHVEGMSHVRAVSVTMIALSGLQNSADYQICNSGIVDVEPGRPEQLPTVDDLMAYTRA